MACSDACCEGAKKPQDHVMRKIFPSLKKWPLADPFHKVQIITDSMVAGHEDYAQACRYAVFPRLFFPFTAVNFARGPGPLHLVTYRRCQPLYSPIFGRDIGAVVASPCERDEYRCAMSLVESGYSAEDTVAKAVGPWGKRYIRTSTP